MNPQHFLVVAKELAKVSDGSPMAEAKHRSAISRAYYAAFNAANKFLSNKAGIEIVDNTQSVHLTVRKPFLNCSNFVARQVSVELTSLASERTRADYDFDDTDPETGKNAEVACEKAQEVFDKLSQCQMQNLLPTIREAMRKWVKTNPGQNLKST
jgi:uncharacterized protein (UPF0332 family)